MVMFLASDTWGFWPLLVYMGIGLVAALIILAYWAGKAKAADQIISDSVEGKSLMIFAKARLDASKLRHEIRQNLKDEIPRNIKDEWME